MYLLMLAGMEMCGIEARFLDSCAFVYLIRAQSQYFISFPASINRMSASENADNLMLNCTFMGTFLNTFGY